MRMQLSVLHTKCTIWAQLERDTTDWLTMHWMVIDYHSDKVRYYQEYAWYSTCTYAIISNGTNGPIENTSTSIPVQYYILMNANCEV